MKFSPFAATAAAAFAIAGNIISTSEAAVYDEREFGPYYPYQPSHYGPAAACVFQPEAQLTLFECITPGTAICRDGWTFGIEGHNEGYVKLWDPKGVDVYAEFPGAKKLCIGERSGDHPYSWYHEETPFLYVLYDHGHSQAWLHCAGVGKEDKDALLKIVNLEDKTYIHDDPIVKFRKGPGYSNALWWVNAWGETYIDYGCEWYFETKKTKHPTEHPTKAPSNRPSDEPSLSPSRSPSDFPSSGPSETPSSSPSDVPSRVPSSSPSDTPSSDPTVSDEPSLAPSASGAPSDVPSRVPSSSPAPSLSTIPSGQPSLSSRPTGTAVPSFVPSNVPSAFPTVSARPSSPSSTCPDHVVVGCAKCGQVLECYIDYPPGPVFNKIAAYVTDDTTPTSGFCQTKGGGQSTCQGTSNDSDNQQQCSGNQGVIAYPGSDIAGKCPNTSSGFKCQGGQGGGGGPAALSNWNTYKINLDEDCNGVEDYVAV
eukprot:CAMPEP_0178641248 /NCGR_PEP_ID=MMETSP0698-20121128/16476_1 /TAXON_ID=265572 /ORGANISM="Extubocellulus spinifer, Strain CCMP396" /LENGTH=480 /DNA_ID=CAMNT_0020281797 /DNA_START=41 /DNA_END=1484 /DNA_ORIENTATION=+